MRRRRHIVRTLPRKMRLRRVELWVVAKPSRSLWVCSLHRLHVQIALDPARSATLVLGLGMTDRYLDLAHTLSRQGSVQLGLGLQRGIAN